MNKKNILSEIEGLAQRNNALFDENAKLKIDNDALLSKVSSLEQEIKDLTAIIYEKESYISELENRNITNDYEASCLVIEENQYIESPNAAVVTENNEINEKTVTVDYGSGVDLASTAIGSVVLRCSELCAEFAEIGGTNAKDLINLALGRTEVFKSEALSVIEEFDNIADVSAELQKRINTTFDYFDLLKRQM